MGWFFLTPETTESFHGLWNFLSRSAQETFPNAHGFTFNLYNEPNSWINAKWKMGDDGNDPEVREKWRASPGEWYVYPVWFLKVN